MGAEIWMIIVFLIGYLLIVLEHPFRIDKTAPALIMGVITWAIHILTAHHVHVVSEQFMHHLGEISSIIFFLLGAMTIVEIIDIHDGFHVIINKITTTNKRKLIWTICVLTFFLSAILDNLTTAIVMGSLLTKLVKNREERLMFAGMVVISANAGGAWSPIGDVTTTMLWIKGQISILPVIKSVFLPSLVCMLVPLAVVSMKMKGELERVKVTTIYKTTAMERRTVLFLGVGLLLFVPVFKIVTHLPPFMGMFFGVGVLWFVTDIMHVRKRSDEKTPLSVFTALSRVDTASVLFFFGILAAIAALESIGTLQKLALFLDNTLGNIDVIVLAIGVLSAIVDNVPLVAAAQGMYPMEIFEQDSHLWHFIAYSAGTGGSMLIIGSAAGVAIMGILKIDFIWYLRKIGWLAFLGYMAGAGVYLAFHYWA
ncbi:MAG: sodium:proton antiporter [Bacteroidetes bacterium]|nr:sodium:proton antiporter [Bacteroidota bacterium]